MSVLCIVLILHNVLYMMFICYYFICSFFIFHFSSEAWKTWDKHKIYSSKEVYVWKTAKQCLPEISLSHILKLKWALKRKIQNNLANGWLCLLQTKVKSVNNSDNKNQGNRKQYLNIFQSNIVSFWKDLSWPDFKDEPRVQEKQEVKHQQSCIFVFVPCLTIPGSN